MRRIIVKANGATYTKAYVFSVFSTVFIIFIKVFFFLDEIIKILP